ncbi:MAG TPA: calcineurin-like phosphoesterase family protein [Bacteroidales bacterium]|nr:calcineurin-like phosphoesterase family protein [Bacteroidales bacterium]
MKKLINLFLIAFALLTFSVLISGCSKDESNSGGGDGDGDTFKLTGVSIPGTLSVTLNSNLTITANGFAIGDIIKFTSKNNPSDLYQFPVSNVTATSASINIGSAINSGVYNISVIRGSKEIYIGSTTLSIQPNTSIPDISGKNIKGVIYCNGRGIPNVVVSDGVEVTKSDANGIYYLQSEKKHGYVFISVPSNYEVATVNKLPQFYKPVAGITTVNQCDFELFESNNENYVVIAMADMHLANRNSDISQFKNGFYAEVAAYATQVKNSGKKIYGLTLGDMTWDAYWYSNSYSLPNYVNDIDGIGFQIFNTMGNHDNDPYQVGDFDAEAAFKSKIGPSYYSFNLGQIHYVVLDDISYINSGGSQGVVGDRNYTGSITPEQLAWLSKDLSEVADKTKPLVIAMHIPLYTITGIDAQGKDRLSLNLTSSGSSLINILSQFTSVKILSGHTHVNKNMEISNNLYEYNIASVCATWWWTGRSDYGNNHIAPDGSTGGYGIIEVAGNTFKYKYKGIGTNKGFRAYDRNMIEITNDKYAPNATGSYAISAAAYPGEYSNKSTSNNVLINVFNWDSACSLEVKENGKTLDVTRKFVKDPLHIISYPMKRFNLNAEPTFDSATTSHMFEVTASNATSTLEIKLTDRFGNIYTESMTRPKPFILSME